MRVRVPPPAYGVRSDYLVSGEQMPVAARIVAAADDFAGSEGTITKELISRFLHEAAAVQAHVHRVPRAELPAGVATLLAECSLAVVDPGLGDVAGAVRRRGTEVLGLVDQGTGEYASAWEAADAGVVLALGAIADTGTVLVGPGTGMEGLAAVLPSRCVLVVPAETIHPDLSSALSWVATVVATAGTRVVFITGPSRTSDIELTPVIGVHGPLRLDVVVVDG